MLTYIILIVIIVILWLRLKTAHKTIDIELYVYSVSDVVSIADF